MSNTYIPVALRRLVEKRANYCCEYCLCLAGVSFFPHEADNLAFTCWRCNRYKGTDLGSFDPLTNEFSFLFNPRTQKWSKHFSLDRWGIIGLTPEGRTTSQLLQFNSDERLVERKKRRGF